MKKNHYTTSDIISHLPENIIDNILVRMPLRDAVRTSALSNKWRYNWRKIPLLVFDNTLSTVLPDQVPATDRLLVTIYHVLLLHRGPKVKFTLSIPELESCSEIDALLNVALGDGVRELTLQIWKGIPQKLPSSLFSCQQLTHLNLRSCAFEPPTNFKGFCRVVCLEFYEVLISADTFASLVSSCPLLEQFIFESSTSFPSVEIVAPKLKVLNLIGFFKFICVKNAPHLANVSICLKPSTGVVRNGRVKFYWVSLLRCLPVVENLCMDVTYVMFTGAGVSAKSFPKLRNLKILELSGASLLVGILLVMNSPKLQKVIIGGILTRLDHEDAVSELLNCTEDRNGHMNQLQEVEMRHVSGTTDELGFMEFILANSPKLESLVVKPDQTKVFDGGLRILKELSKFERLSPKAKITYKDPSENQA